MFITNVPEIAAFVESVGVQRIFVDLEINGKLERQGHLDTVISKHSIGDVEKIKQVLNKAELLVRVNPLFEGSLEEINKVIESGADIIMLPMFKTLEEVAEVGNIIAGRAKFMPLVETVDAVEIIEEVSSLDCVDEIHIGLNDLHLEMGLSFMFELISNGYIERALHGVQKPYGVGGIAKVNSGIVPAEDVMQQHVMLDSSGVILSRAFHNSAQTLADLKVAVDFETEFALLQSTREKCLLVPESEFSPLKLRFSEKVNAALKGEK
jgi:hypothetical protein